MQNKFRKLETLTLKGFKSIRAIDALAFADINIVLGPNGAGKSNFVGFFPFIARLAREELQDYVAKQGGLDKLLFFGPKTTEKLEIRFRSDRNEYSATLEPTTEGGLVFADERCKYLQFEHTINHPGQAETRLRRPLSGGQVSKYIYEPIENWRVYHFHDTSAFAPLRSLSRLTEPERLDADGGNLAAFLYYLQEKGPDVLAAVTAALRRVAPFFGGFVLRPEALNPDTIRLRWRHRGRDPLFDVSDLSDGTLRFVALAALLLQPDPPSTIVLDEPELGLHPAALAELAALMHEVAPRVQIIAATQSPTFANHFGWRDVIMVDRVKDASTFRRLTEAEVAPWASDHGIGDLWERNLIGGRP
ncbi:AAA family ATPase [Salinarimonas sp. NSM]|uniref:AAA family ATPase n=1 Tax=Salinarimonas sp. NSM TaxID=3458003 RepID=UPI0040364B6F